MKSDLYTKKVCRALVVGVAFAGSAAMAAQAEQQDSTTPEPVKVVVATQANTPMASGATDQRYPPLQRGVRQAAQQGPEALRRYISRTRMIYNYYFWDFAKQE